VALAKEGGQKDAGLRAFFEASQDGFAEAEKEKILRDVLTLSRSLSILKAPK